MGRFKDIAQGTRQRKRGVDCTTLAGVAFQVDLRLLDGNEEEDAVACAKARSKEKGGDGSENDLTFQFANAVEIVLRAAVDPASPDDAPEPFFADADEVRSGLDRERILLLSELQRVFQETHSPRRGVMSEGEFINHVYRLALDGGDLDPFWRLPLSMRDSFTRILVKELVISQQVKSLSTSLSKTPATS